MKMVLYAIVTGDPVPSFSPWPLPSEEGGGVVLRCNFIIYSSPVFIQNYNNQISDLIKDNSRRWCAPSPYVCKTVDFIMHINIKWHIYAIWY